MSRWEIVNLEDNLIAFCRSKASHPILILNETPWMLQLNQKQKIFTIKLGARVERVVTHELLIEYGGLTTNKKKNISDVLLNVLSTKGINWRRTKSIDTQELFTIFGIEAGRKTIINEISETMNIYGIDLDKRHLCMLADTMTFKGKILGCQRHGLKNMKDSTLALASYETTVKILCEGARFEVENPIVGTDESCIMGRPSPGGTGICNLVRKINPSLIKPLRTRPPFLLGNLNLTQIFKPMKTFIK